MSLNTTFPNGDSPSVLKSDMVKNVWVGTQAKYDSIETKDPNTLYLVVN